MALVLFELYRMPHSMTTCARQHVCGSRWQTTASNRRANKCLVCGGAHPPLYGGGGRHLVNPGVLSWEKIKFTEGNIDLGQFWCTDLLVSDPPPPLPHLFQ